MSEESDFKEREKEAEDFYDYDDLAQDVLSSGNKEYAKKLIQKALDLAEESEEVNSGIATTVIPFLFE